jgi:cell wall-associated NlpC family hydrolase
MKAQIIVDFARKYIGSHYLWGAGGSTPGKANGVWYRQDVVKLAPTSLDPRTATVGAAQCDQQGTYVCAGNYGLVSGCRPANPADVDLVNYLAQLRQLPPGKDYPPFASRFTPRVMKGGNIGKAHNGLLAWGEDCRGRRHFDCISFVNWVLSWTTTLFWWKEIWHYASDASGTTGVAMDDPPVPGDILVRGKEHIGLLCETGRVIQAQDHAHGVHENERYTPALWSARRRLPDNMIIRTMQQPGDDGVATIEYTWLS